MMFGLRKPSPRWNDVVYWALDLETTGLDPKGDEILSCGMVPIRKGSIRWGERYYALARPTNLALVTREALRVHHILPHEVAGAAPLAEVVDAVCARIAEGPLLVHWKTLDVAFLRNACRRCGREWPKPKIVDTVDLIARLERRRRFIDPQAETEPADLAGARQRFGLPMHIWHHALFDALATAELFLALRSRLEAETLRELV